MALQCINTIFTYKLIIILLYLRSVSQKIIMLAWLQVEQWCTESLISSWFSDNNHGLLQILFQYTATSIFCVILCALKVLLLLSKLSYPFLIYPIYHVSCMLVELALCKRLQPRLQPSRINPFYSRKCGTIGSFHSTS